MLTNSDVVELTEFRRHLHRHPEVSGEEAWTAAEVTRALKAIGAPLVVTGLGGHGVAAVWQGAEAGETVMFRSELDALPITDQSGAEWASTIAGKGHQCGHDGHSTIMLGLARLIARRPPAKGRVVILFQPSEEDGAGAAAVLADPQFEAIRPDWAYSLHNFPGLPLGEMAIEAGDANCASRGLKVVLEGHTSHASTPEHALSPALSLARLIPAVMAAGPGGADLGPDFRLVTVTHASMGEQAFGITPGRAELWMTLRTVRDEAMAALLSEVTGLIEAECAATGLRASFSHHDIFQACVNEASACEVLRRAAEATGMKQCKAQFPMRGSEDFGLFGSRGGARAAMFRLGSGVTAPKLHNPDYDFPDSLIAPAVHVFEHVLREHLGG